VVFGAPALAFVGPAAPDQSRRIGSDGAHAPQNPRAPPPLA
jgi:hypothetical protein